MTIRALNLIVGKAIISDQFRIGLMNGSRAELMRDYDLEPDEMAEVIAIQANTPVEFYAAIYHMVDAREAARRVSQPAAASEGVRRSLEAIMRRAAAGLPAPA